jgi:hypothetical protein
MDTSAKSINQFINPFMHQSIHPSIHPYINPSIHQSIHPSIRPSIDASIHPFNGILLILLKKIPMTRFFRLRAIRYNIAAWYDMDVHGNEI